MKLYSAIQIGIWLQIHILEPNNFAELFSFACTLSSKGEGKERTILVWNEKEFIKKKNLAAFIVLWNE